MPAQPATVTAMAVPCPSCEAALPAGAASCPSCSLPLRGPAAARLWEVDQLLAALTRERVTLLTVLRTQGPAMPVVPAPVVAAAGSHWTGPQLLLAGGALLVLAAAAVFLAVAWSAIGVGGQLAAMASLTAATAWGAVQASRRGSRATGEALGAVTAGVLLLSLTAARALPLGALGQVNGYAYGAGAGVGAAAALAACFLAGERLRSFAIGAHVAVSTAVAASAAGLAALAGHHWEAVTFATAAVLASAGLGAFARFGPQGWGLLRTGAAGPALTWASVATLASAGTGVGPVAALAFEGPTASMGAVRAAAMAVLLLIGLGLGSAVVAVQRGAGGALPAGPGIRGVRVVAASLVAAVAGGVAVLVPGFALGGAVTAACVVTVAGSVAAVAATRPVSGTAVRLGWAAAAVALAAAALSALVWASPVAFAVVLCSAAVVAAPAWRSQTWRPVAVGAQVLLVGSAAWVFGVDVDGGWAAVPVAVVAVGAALLAARTASPVTLCLLAGAGLWFTVAAALAVEDHGPLAGAGVAAGAAALAGWHARTRPALAVAAAVAGTAAVWLVLADRQASTVEAYSLPAAALALAAAVRVAGRSGSSRALLGAPLVVALVPSAVAAAAGGGVLRAGLLVVVSAVTLWAGVRAGWQAPVVAGGAALVWSVAVLAHPYSHVVPRWVLLGGVGAALLVAGFRYDSSTARARRLAQAVATMR